MGAKCLPYMIINKTEVKKIAKLACLHVSETDISHYQNLLSKVTKIFDSLKDVDTKDVVPMTNTLNNSIVMYDDVPVSSCCKLDITVNATKTQEGYYSVPKIID